MKPGSVWAPKPHRVRIRIADQTFDMSRDASDRWHAPEPLMPGTDFAYLLDDDNTALTDPRSQWQPDGVFGPSRSYDHTAFRWTDQAWTGRTLPGSVLY